MNATPDASWIRNGYIAVPGGLHLSFQRYFLSTDGRMPQPLPSSLGALPCGLGCDGALLLPLAWNEAFWIGLDAENAGAALRFTVTAVSRGRRLAPIEIVLCASTGRIEAYAGTGGELWSFARDVRRPRGPAGCSHLACRIEATSCAGAVPSARCVIRLVDRFAFTRESGRPAPPPINAAGGYRGELLP